MYPILAYCCESWAALEKYKSSITSIEMRCFWKLQSENMHGQNQKQNTQTTIKNKTTNSTSQLMQEEKIKKKIYETRPLEKNNKGRPIKQMAQL